MGPPNSPAWVKLCPGTVTAVIVLPSSVPRGTGDPMGALEIPAGPLRQAGWWLVSPAHTPWSWDSHHLAHMRRWTGNILTEMASAPADVSNLLLTRIYLD